ncbi:MAG: hypothetical protein QOE84_2270, partial [Actinomycetota bacterium]|nr:hypothetical protein [Actinomycetota bacterium]
MPALRADWYSRRLARTSARGCTVGGQRTAHHRLFLAMWNEALLLLARLLAPPR